MNHRDMTRAALMESSCARIEIALNQALILKAIAITSGDNSQYLNADSMDVVGRIRQQLDLATRLQIRFKRLFKIKYKDYIFIELETCVDPIEPIKL